MQSWDGWEDFPSKGLKTENELSKLKEEERETQGSVSDRVKGRPAEGERQKRVHKGEEEG